MIIPLERKQEVEDFLNLMNVEEDSIKILSKDNKYYIKGSDSEVDDLTTYLMIKYPGFQHINVEYRNQNKSCTLNIHTVDMFHTLDINLTTPYLTSTIDNKVFKTSFLNEYLLLLDNPSLDKLDYCSDINLEGFGRYTVNTNIMPCLDGYDCFIRFIPNEGCIKSSDNHIFYLGESLAYSTLINFSQDFHIPWNVKAKFPQAVQDKLSLYQSTMLKMKNHLSKNKYFFEIPAESRLNFIYNPEKELEITIDSKIKIHYSIMNTLCSYIVKNFDSFSDPIFKPFLNYIMTQHLPNDQILEIKTADDINSNLHLVELVNF